jgi:ATP-binding cassette subfamily F protein uup
VKKETLQPHEEKSGSASSVAQPNGITEQSPAVKRKMSYKEKREWEQIEKDLARLNTEKDALLLKMSKGDLPFSELESAGQQMTQVQSALDQLEMRWLELSELLPAG